MEAVGSILHLRRLLVEIEGLASSYSAEERSNVCQLLGECARKVEGLGTDTPAPKSLSEAVIDRFSFDHWRLFTENLIDQMEIRELSVQSLIWSYLQSRLQKIQALAFLLADPEDEPELRDHLVYWYVESKAEWFQFNCRVNYTTVRGETPDPVLVVQASLSSHTLQVLEALFDEQSITLLTDFISAPLPNALLLESFRQGTQSA